MGNGYACDGMFKLNVEMNKVSTSVYMLSSINFWHTRFVILMIVMLES